MRTHLLKPDKVYVVDRGSESYELLAAIRAAGSSFVARVQRDVAFQVAEENDVPAAAAAAGLVRDVRLSRLGTDHHTDWHAGQPVRLVVVENRTPRASRSRCVC